MASLTDAEEALRSSDGNDYFQRLTRLLMCGGVRILKEKFDSFYSPANLPSKLTDPAIQAQLRRARISQAEWDCLYPSPGVFGKSADFDITLIFRLLRTICNLIEPPTGWNNLPNSTDLSLEADLARIKFYRNSVYGHNQKLEISESEFSNLWKEISETLLRIAASISNAKRDEWKKAIDKLLHDPLTTEAERYVDELLLWNKNDMDVKDAVNRVGDQLQLHQMHQKQSNDQLHQKLDYVLEQWGQFVSSSHQPKIPGLKVAAGTEELGFIRLEQPPSKRAEMTHGKHLKANLHDPTTELRSLENHCSGPLNELAEEIPAATPRSSELKLKPTITEKEYKPCQEQYLGVPQAFSLLTDEAKEEDERKRATLHQFYEDTEVCLNTMDDNFRILLERDFGRLEEKMARNKRNLKQDYIVLVAGETSSGKSSLLNLILGEQLLPYSPIPPTTSTICELKYGPKPKLVALETGDTTKTVWLGQSPETPQQSYLQEISSFVHVKTNRWGGSDYKKIELFLPHNLLKQGIVMVDSPGVGECDFMDHIVCEYLPEAFAFIFVISAGRMQKYGVERLMKYALTVSHERQEELSSTRALFVCNKWDQVPPEEAKEVKNYIIKKLTHCWPGLDADSQVIYISSTNALKAQGLGVITDEFAGLIDGIKSMVLKSIEARLQAKWRWLDYLLSRIASRTKALIRTAHIGREQAIKFMMLITERLSKIEKQQSSIGKELQEYLENKTDIAVSVLSRYLKSSEVMEQFISWTLNDVPDTEDSWEMTNNGIQRALMKRLQDVIAAWEEEHHVFADVRTSLIHYFQERFNSEERPLRILADSVLAENSPSPGSGAWGTERDFTTAEKVLIGVTSPIWLPVMLVGSIKREVEGWSRIRKYTKEKRGFMAKVSKEYLTKATEEQNLRRYVVEQLKECQVYLNQVVAHIPELIEADKMLCQQLRDEVQYQKEIEDLYEPLYERILKLRERMAFFCINEVNTMDISCSDLEWNCDEMSCLGKGAFGSVYRGTLKQREGEQPVALKVWKDELNDSNASVFLAWTKSLRKLNHPSIVKFYGVALRKEGDQVRGILVMELCKENLMTYIFKNPENVPGLPSSTLLTERNTIRWAKNIANALEFIHRQGFIHWDLKLENILISQEGVVKIADAGVFKEAKTITGTMTGTPVYVAPEGYTYTANIYSFGIMMWEMWYGKRAFLDEVEDLNTLFEKVAEGVRPSHVEGRRKPPDGWRFLMQSCWDGDADKRPTAARCHKELMKL